MFNHYTIDMKVSLLAIAIITVAFEVTSQNVGINASGVSPNASAMLDISSSQKGVLIPRMTDVQRQLLKDPIAGLLIYNLTSGNINYYTGAEWQSVSGTNVSTNSGSGSSLTSGVAINTSGNDPDPSAILDIASEDKGLLIPRTTKGAVSTVEGLLIFSTSSNTIDYYNGTDWVSLCGSTVDNIFGTGAVSQGVALNDNGAISDPSAILDISSSSKGVLLPRMTSVNRDVIKSPATGLIIYNTVTGQLEAWNGSGWYEMSSAVGGACIEHCLGVTTTVVDVVSAGQTWMDRNIGATQQATSSTDANSYGDLYQWGRLSDGHQCRTSTTTTALSSTDVPGHNQFILDDTFPFDWRDPQNGNLWQGVNGVNNPCPNGYRVPTITEWTNERLSWFVQDIAGAFASPLKLSLSGMRNGFTGALQLVGTQGHYWSSTTSADRAGKLVFRAGFTSTSSPENRYHAFPVRCIKN